MTSSASTARKINVVVFLEVSHDTLVHFVDLADALLDGPVAFAAERVVLYVNP